MLKKLYNKSIPRSQCYQCFLETMTHRKSTVNSGQSQYCVLKNEYAKNKYEHFYKQWINTSMYASWPCITIVWHNLSYVQHNRFLCKNRHKFVNHVVHVFKTNSGISIHFRNKIELIYVNSWFMCNVTLCRSNIFVNSTLHSVALQYR